MSQISHLHFDASHKSSTEKMIQFSFVQMWTVEFLKLDRKQRTFIHFIYLLRLNFLLFPYTIGVIFASNITVT